MSRAVVREIQCKSVINRVQGMPFRWSANPYRGCSHACVYCYARTTHTYLELDPGEDFQRILFAKVNAPEVIRRELARRSWQRELVAIGTSTDPYQPIEGTYRLTRGLLEAMVEYRNPASITTKGTLVVRDADVLQELGRVAGCTVYLSIGTLDPEVWQKTEPGTPSPRQRLRALERLAACGIRAAVLLAPIIPGLSDSTASMQAVMTAAREAGAVAVHPIVLRVEPEVRAYFMDSMESLFPQTARGYRWLYGQGRYAPRAYVQQVERRGGTLLTRAGFASPVPPTPAVPPAAATGAPSAPAMAPAAGPRQLTLAI